MKKPSQNEAAFYLHVYMFKDIDKTRMIYIMKTRIHSKISFKFFSNLVMQKIQQKSKGEKK